MRPTYVVRYERDDNGDWLVTVPDIPSAHTFGRTLSHARDMAREVVALVLDVDPDSFDLTDKVLLEPSVDRVVQGARDARAHAESANAEAQDATAAALELLDDLTVRDAAEILGLSFQRVHQLRAAARAETHRRPVTKMTATRRSGGSAAKRGGGPSDVRSPQPRTTGRRRAAGS